MHSRFRAPTLLTALALGLTGCSDAPTPAADEPAVDDSSRVQQEIVTVTLTEGTNLAVAVTSAGERRVLAIQGQLFIDDSGEGTMRALTDAYLDAREPQLDSTGERVAFHGYANGTWDIFEVEIATGAVSALTTGPFDDREPQYSPDGTEVAFSSDRGGRYDIWLRAADGQLTQFTTTDGNASSPSFSSDGSSIAYANDGFDGASVVVSSRDGETRTIATSDGSIAGVSFGADDRLIAFQERTVVDGEIVTRLATVEVESGAITTHSADDADVFPFRAGWVGADLVFAADGVVKRKRLDSPAEVWPFAADVDLTRDRYTRRARDYDASKERPVLGLRTPQISEDGTSVFFAALGDLWRWRPETEELTQLTDDPYAEISFALSPNEREIALVSDRSGTPKLYVLDLESMETTPIDIPADGVSGPQWSPDGNQIAVFTAIPTNPLGAQIIVIDRRDGSQEPILTPLPAMPLSWSRDGQRLAVARLNPYSSRYREGVYELIVANTNDGTTHKIVPTEHRSIRDAVLSPDGAMTYTQGGLLHRLELDDELAALESGGTVTAELTDTPAWSAGGSYLVYQNGNAIKRLEAASGRVDDISPPLTYRLDEPSDVYIVRAGKVFTSDPGADGYLENVDIRIEGGRIVSIGPIDDSSDLEIVDATDQAVIPGLFEMHAHMGTTSETQGRTWLAFGVTTVRDPGADPYTAKATQEAWDSGRRIGPRTHVTGFLADGNRVYYSMAEGIVSDAHLDLVLERIEKLELDFVKTYVRFPDQWQRRVVDFAHGLGIPVSSHELYPAVAHGMDHVEHIGGTSRRGYQPKVSAKGRSYGDVVTLLAESGMGITPTAVLPGFAVIALDEPDWFETPQFDYFYGVERKMAYRAMAGRFGGGAAADTADSNGRFLRALTDRGALVVSGTDSPFVPYGAGLHAEFRLYARGGLSSAEILRTATIQAARAAGVDAELGSITPGKLADLVIVDGDPLADIRDADNVVMTIKNGRRYALDDLLRLPE